MPEIRFDDAQALQAAISDEWGEFGEPFTITQALIDAFAELSGDHQWIHVDVERSKRESPFKATIAHGALMVAIMPRLRPTASLRIVGYKNALNYGIDNLRFLAPTPAGASVHACSRLAGFERRDKGTMVKTAFRVEVVGAPRPSLILDQLVLYQG